MHQTATFELPFAPMPMQGTRIPDQRTLRIAARRAFVEMKLRFINAASDIEGPIGDLLRHKVRIADEPPHLWRLRSALLAELPTWHHRTPYHRNALRYQPDTHFSDSGSDTCFAPL